jgi:hypothetical protein
MKYNLTERFGKKKLIVPVLLTILAISSLSVVVGTSDRFQLHTANAYSQVNYVDSKEFEDVCSNEHTVYVSVTVQPGLSAGILNSYSVPSSTKEFWPVCNTQNLELVQVYICINPTSQDCVQSEFTVYANNVFPYGGSSSSGGPVPYTWIVKGSTQTYKLQPGDQVVIIFEMYYGYLQVNHQVTFCFTPNSQGGYGECKP